jgi:4-hydroxy-3-polyprenylbenzoate decarboxylase
MMFSKFIVVVSGDTDIRNYSAVLAQIERNCRIGGDLMLLKGPLDVLDHSSDTYSFGGKMGIDATEKMAEELQSGMISGFSSSTDLEKGGAELILRFPKTFREFLVPRNGILLLIVSQNATSALENLRSVAKGWGVTIIILLEEGTPYRETDMIMWQITGNTDPQRDITVEGGVLIIDATFKYSGRKGFQRKWPNVVVSSKKTIEAIDERWNSITGLNFIGSPSVKLSAMVRGDSAEVNE